MIEDSDATDRLWAMADLVTPMAIRVAATLRIADHLASGRRSVSQLADAAGGDADRLDRVLRHLAARGVLRRERTGEYELTERGEALREDHPRRMRAVLDLDGAVGRAELSFAQLLYTVRTGEPAFPVQFGRPFWEDLASDPARSASFDAQMGSDVSGWVPAILSAYDWGSLGHVADVGGGNGSLLIGLLTEYPELRGTVIDLPGPADAARESLTAAGLANRADVVDGSFFDPLPAGAGGYLLTAIVHDWDDEAAFTILGRCREAAGASGKVFVIEKIGSDGASPSTEMDLRLLAYFGGRERSLAELVALTESAGFQVAARHKAGPVSILELARR